MGATDLASVARSHSGTVPLWGQHGEDLNVNLITLESDAGIGEHVNTEVDVLVVGVEGEGVVEVDGQRHALRPGHALFIAKGSRRSVTGDGERFSYLSCHRRRDGLWPQLRRQTTR